MQNHAKQLVQELLFKAGITLNGQNPWDIKVHDERLYRRVLAQGSLGFGEAYMDGWWDAEKLDECLTKILHAKIEKDVSGNWKIALHAIAARLFNMQSHRRAFKIGEAHYDIGNDLYRAMLGSRITYTCGYWSPPTGGATNLDEAQDAKLDL